MRTRNLPRPHPHSLALHVFPLLLLPCIGCELQPFPVPSDGNNASSSSGTGGSGGSGTVDLGANELPCDVRDVIQEVCAHCHSSPVSAGAPSPLLSRYDFLASNAISGKTMGTLSLERMKSMVLPMPPLSEPPMSASQLDIFEQWVAAEMPSGTCGSVPEKPIDPPCTSGKFWDINATSTAQMNPGQACRSCHKTQASDYNYFFMGTVFPSFHEKDLCLSAPPSGAKVEILDMTGAVTMTLSPNATGNFMSSAVVAGVPIPYTARLVANGVKRSMTMPQKDGDCNKCHSEQGDEHAPGRLVWPRDYDAPLPPTPPVLVSLIPMGDAVHVVWTAKGCDKILMYRNEEGGEFSLQYTLGGTVTEQHDDGAYAPSKVYCYHLQCKAGGVASEDSNELCGSP